MPPTRYQVFNQRKDAVFPFAPAIPVPTERLRQTQAVDRKVIEQEQTRAREVEHKGLDTTWLQYARVPLVRFVNTNSPLAVLAFQVPAGRVLVLKRVQWWVSEPFVYVSGQFGWRITIDGSHAPFMASTGGYEPGYLYVPLYAFAGDPLPEPLYIQENSVLGIEIKDVLPLPRFAFDDYLAASFYAFGELRKPVGGVT